MVCGRLRTVSTASSGSPTVFAGSRSINAPIGDFATSTLSAHISKTPGKRSAGSRSSIETLRPRRSGMGCFKNDRGLHQYFAHHDARWTQGTQNRRRDGQDQEDEAEALSGQGISADRGRGVRLDILVDRRKARTQGEDREVRLGRRSPRRSLEVTAVHGVDWQFGEPAIALSSKRRRSPLVLRFWRCRRSNIPARRQPTCGRASSSFFDARPSLTRSTP